ncbi:MAG TPA: ATP-binding protein [Motiliproteus sp.]
MRIRSLFWKLLVGFWLMMMGLLLVNMATTWLVTSHFEASGRQDALLERYAQQAAQVYAAKGTPGLQQWRRQLLHEQHLRALLLDQQGRNLGERPWRWFAPPESHDHPPPFEHGPGRHRSQRPLLWPTNWQGDNYTLVILNPKELIDPWFARFTLAWRIGVSVLVVALLAFLMARYITRPVAILGQASRNLAAGDLQTRVSATLGERKDELGDLGRDFDRMAERIQTLLQGQQQLLRDVSHELRTPLARQRVALELARRKPDPSGELNRIEREAEQLDQLIEEMLQLLRLSDPEAPCQLQPCDLAALVQGQVESARFEQPRVNYHGPSTLPTQLEPRQIERALENVIRNALKYSQDEVEVELVVHRGQNQIQVQDRGPGIDPAQLQRIFDPFVRTDSARNRDAGGWGLGLAIAARALARHGGQISAHNRAGGGLCVTLTLPAQDRT